MGSKTPVSILQELMMRKGCPPHYELICGGVGSHDAIFKYEVQAGNVKAIGSGRSKKEAKHDAARTVLERLKETGVISLEPDVYIEENILDIVSPYKDKIQDNAVGALQDLCVTNKIPQPEYVLVGDEGPPHAKKFTFVCSVSKMKENGIGRTKKQAKQLAASNMLYRLKESLGSHLEVPLSPTNNPETDESVSKAVIAKYLEFGHPGRRQDIGQKVSDVHLSWLHLKSELLSGLQDDLSDVESGTAFDLVKKIADELNVELLVEIMAHSAPGWHFVVLILMTVPEAFISGTGRTLEDAKESAAKDMLRFLKVMTREPPKVELLVDETMDKMKQLKVTLF